MTSPLSRLLTGVSLLFGVLSSAAGAQQATVINGRVTNEANAPIIGVSVSIPTLNVGTLTTDDGRYSFAVPAAKVTGQSVSMVARRIGFIPISRTIVLLPGAPIVQDFKLAVATTQLEGVVITALGMTREKSQLGTAQQQISNAELTTTRSTNVMTDVQGKVSGVQITSAGPQGGSANVIIRGQNSITGNNQPLYVIDGIPISNYDRGGSVINGYDFGSAINDLNPDDVESMTILKGPNAAALYGSRAANGAVLITTKKGIGSRGKILTEVNTSYSWERPSRFWDFQDQYGQGAGGEFAYVNGAGKGVNDGADQSWGPKLDGRLNGCVFVPGTTTYDQSKPCLQFTAPQGGLPWAPHPDNVESFFDTGGSFAGTVGVSGGTDIANARLSIGTDQQKGVVPDNRFTKIYTLLNGFIQINPKLSSAATVQYLRNQATNRPGSGYSNSTLEQFFWFGRQVDMGALQNFQQGGAVNGGPPNREFNWNYNYHNNPVWLASENPIQDTRDRFIGSLSATWRFNNWLNLTGRTGSDIFGFDISQKFSQGNLVNADPKFNGAFRFFRDYSNENNSDILLSADRQLNQKVQLVATAGAASRLTRFTSDTSRTTGISVPGIFNVSNAAVTPTLGQSLQRKATRSLYAAVAGTYNGWATLEGTARNDWSSTLPIGENSYFYPSVNTSIVLTDMIPGLKGTTLSYAKIRGSIARVGNDAEPYQLQTVFTGVPQKFAGLPQFSLGNTLANAALKPEITTSGEAGVELGFASGRATLDATIYNKTTRNQIFNVTVSSTTGFSSKAINAGAINNRGFEALLSVTAVQMTNSFVWVTGFNYSHNRSRVVDLAPGVNTVVLGQGIFAEVNVEARRGEPYGLIFGQGFQRDSATGQLLTDGGVPIPANGFIPLGNIQPRWTGGWNNQFTYKKFTFGFLLDFRRGGQIISETNAVGEYSGVLAGSLRGREIDFNNPGIVVQGIDVNTGQPNTVNVTAETFFQSTFPAIEPYIFDGGWTKLREMRFTYELPQKWANRLIAQNVAVAIVGRNLHTWTSVPNIDPEFTYSTGNFQGIEYAIPANPRSIGFNVRITP